MTVTVIPQGWHPVVKAWVGEADKIFANAKFGDSYVHDLLADSATFKQADAPQFAILPGTGDVILRSTATVENTRLGTTAPTTTKPVSPYENVTNPDLDAAALTYAGRYATPDGAFTGANAWKNTVHTFTRAQDEFDMWFPQAGEAVNSPFRDTGTWHECVPDRSDPCVRLFQSWYSAWTATQLTSAAKLNPDPHIVIELERKQPPAEQAEKLTPVYIFYPDGSVKYTDVLKPVINVTLGQGSHGNEYRFVFIEGQVPCAIRVRDGQICWADAGTVVDLPADQRLKLELRWAPPGQYILTGNMLTAPWVVSFKYAPGFSPTGAKTATTPEPISIPAATMSVGFVGVGCCSFAFAPIRYPKGSMVFKSRRLTLPFAATNYSGKISSPSYTLPAGVSSKDTNAKIKVALAVKPETTVTEFWYEITVDNTDDRYTPYLHSAIVNWLPKIEQPSSLTSIVDDPHIQAINITPQIENVFKIKQSGSITFTNFAGEWDNLGAQLAIRIHYKRSTDDTDIDDESLCIFKGYATRIGLPRRGIVEKYATYSLVDRWLRLSDMKISNSPYFDGVNWFQTLQYLARLGGFSSDDIRVITADSGEEGVAISDYVTSGKYGRFVLPLVFNAKENPQYKFKFGMSIEQCIDEIHKLLRIFITINKNGVLQLIEPEAISARDTITFSDSLAETPDGQTLGIDNVWYSLTPFDYSKDPAVIRNFVQVAGPDFSVDRSFYAAAARMYDNASIIDVNAFNYIGYVKPYMFSQTYLCNQAMRQYLAADIYRRVRMPQEDVTWSTRYVPIPLFTPVQFIDGTGTVPAEQTFYIYGNEFAFDAAKMSVTSNLQAKLVRGLIGAVVAVEG